MRLKGWVLSILITAGPLSEAAPHATSTVVLGPLTGFDAALHPANSPELTYFGTDLGWSYRWGNEIRFLFGDTWASDKGDPIDPRHDDAFGSISLSEYPVPDHFLGANLPRVRLAQRPGTRQLAGLDAGRSMESLKTPLAGFSSGGDEFAIFITGKPQACTTDRDCGFGLSCDARLGFVGAPPEQDVGLTFPCRNGSAGCLKLPASRGLCADPTSSLSSRTEFGMVAAAAIRHLVAVRDPADDARYTHTREWLTNKFYNVAARAVAAFGPAGDRPVVLLWGRPGFVGVNARQETLSAYFAYADMPEGPDYPWTVHYFTGLDNKGHPDFAADPARALALDLDAGRAGSQSREVNDLVQQMSVVWIERLHKWVMFYGGGISRLPLPSLGPRCGILEIFARSLCRDVRIGNGALRMRSADNPWGPWSSPEDLFVGGDPDSRPVEKQYAAGGVLHHPKCKASGCQQGSPSLPPGDYGWLYGANIIEEWTRPSGNGVDIVWNASTWNPYRVILLRSHLEP